MKVLAIAYACEPGRGSEPGVGWNWVRLIARTEGVSVSVVTRKNNRSVIEKYYENHEKDDIDFLYYDLPQCILRYKKRDKNIKIFYTLWQYGVIKYLKKHIDFEEYDYIWDFNFGSLGLPDFVYKLKKPYIIGPASTKESIPKSYIDNMSFKMKIKYKIQQFMRVHLWINRFAWRTLKGAQLIVTCNEMSRKYLPSGIKSISVFHNGINEEDFAYCDVRQNQRDIVEFVYAGRLIYSKNIEIAIRAFSIVNKTHKNFKFEIYGEGNLEEKLVSTVKQFNLEDKVIFKGRVSQQELLDVYKEKDCFIFPSLLEISSTAVMEAMYFGLVPVCLDIPCMEYILDNDTVIKIDNCSPEEDAYNMAIQIKRILDDRETLRTKKKRCHEIAKRQYLWNQKETSVNRIMRFLLEDD